MPEAHRSSHPTSETNQDGSRAAAPFLRIGHARCLPHKTHLRVMKFPISRTFFSLRADSVSRQKNGPSFGRKSWGPGGVAIRIGSTRRMNAACCACEFHSTPQFASPRQGLLAGTLYSQFLAII